MELEGKKETLAKSASQASGFITIFILLHIYFNNQLTFESKTGRPGMIGYRGLKGYIGLHGEQ